MRKEEFNKYESLAIWTVPQDVTKLSNIAAIEKGFSNSYKDNYFNYDRISNQNMSHVIVGMNPGDAFSASEGSLLNFHGLKKSNDYKLAASVYGTDFWGSYMTDLGTVIESNSAKVSASDLDVNEFLQRIKAVGISDNALIIALGRKTFEAFENYNNSTMIDNKICKIDSHKIYYIQHYSQANGHWNTQQVHNAILRIAGEN